MKHVKLFEAWVSETNTEVWADFEGPAPEQSDLDQFGLRFDTLPSGEPRIDEFGFTVVGDLTGINQYIEFIGKDPTMHGRKRKQTGDWGGVYPGEPYHPQDIPNT